MWPQYPANHEQSVPVAAPKGPAQVKGVGRDRDDSKALFLILDRCPTDDDIRRIHDVLRENHNAD